MCGIAGFLERGGLRADAGDIVAKMARTLVHRGPDDSGVWTDQAAGIAFGHQRLAILDLSAAGAQPMLSPSGRYVATYNGEIYNFPELRAVLSEEEGINWRGSSDTEVLLAAIDHWGVKDALPRLNGMFALALWDREARVLTLARDRMGEKPLYYGRVKGAFLFGSELKAFRSYPGFDASLDQSALSSMFRYDYIPAPRTIWQEFSKLPAGHYVEVMENGAVVGPPTSYWSLKDCATFGIAHRFEDREQMVEDLDQLLRDSVKMRMLADVPVGAFLSGGIDSSVIVALMQAQSTRPVKSFTIGFEEDAFDEAPRAREVARDLGTDHTELYVTSSDALSLIPSLAHWWDEPFGDSSQIPTLLVSRLTRRSVKVALSGDGGDEFFGGYSRFRSMNRVWNGLRRVAPGLRGAGANVLENAAGKSLIRGRVGRASRVLGAQHFEDLYRWRVSRIDEPERLFLNPSPSSDRAFGPVPFLAEPAEKMMFADTTHYLPEDILTKVDRASMAVSLEVRAPFLDHRIAEFSWRLPVSERVTTTDGKRILRAVGSRYLPPRTLDRPKMGFCVPVKAWLGGPLRHWAEDLLSEQRLTRQGLLNASAVRKLWNGFVQGKRHHDRIIWNLLMFELWTEQNSIS